MVLVAPEILADACGLSLGLILAIVPVAFFLWLLGWWSHRFWVVLTTTVVAGIYGLNAPPDQPAPPWVAAVLLALSAGILALALVRLLAFAAGGLAGLLLVHLTFPSLHQPLIAFLLAGLLCLLLFRPCVMALTSLTGSVLLASAVLLLLNYYALLDAPQWCAQSANLLNAAIGAFALLGVAVQLLLDRYVFRRKPRAKGWTDELWELLPTRSAADNGRRPPARRAALR